MILLVMVALTLTLDTARGGCPAAVSKKAADSGFFRPRMISLVMVALILTLDFASGGFPAGGGYNLIR